MNCARWDLCGGYRVTDLPTAIHGQERTYTRNEKSFGTKVYFGLSGVL